MIKKILKIWLNEGFASLLYRTKRKIRKKCYQLADRLATRLEHDAENPQPTTVRNFLNQANYQTTPIPFLKINSSSQRLNLVTDSVNKQSLFGGVATSLILATLFANRQNIPLRIISRTAKSSPKDYEDFLRLMKIPRPHKVEFFSDHKNSRLLEVHEEDIFLSTSWWSSKVVQEVNQRPSFFYLLQEVELFFYPNGDEHWQCQTILQNKSIHYLLNTKILHDYYRNHSFENVIARSTYFEPAFPSHLYEATQDSFLSKSKRKLFFYSRPNNARNLFKTGLEILDAALIQGVLDEKEWEIYFAGTNIPEFTFTSGLKPKVLGQISWQEYRDFTKTVDLCFSLMYTPHPSYPPLDIAASGGVVLTNTYEGKESLPYSDNILCCDLDIDSMLSGFQKAIALTKNLELRQHNYSKNLIERDWNKSFESTLHYMAEHL